PPPPHSTYIPFFFSPDPAPTDPYTLSLHDALPIFTRSSGACKGPINISRSTTIAACYVALKHVFTEVPANAGCLRPIAFEITDGDRKSTRLNSSHLGISYAVFCLKKKKNSDLGSSY